jgi:hypothetical protein
MELDIHPPCREWRKQTWCQFLEDSVLESESGFIDVHRAFVLNPRGVQVQKRVKPLPAMRTPCFGSTSYPLVRQTWSVR